MKESFYFIHRGRWSPLSFVALALGCVLCVISVHTALTSNSDVYLRREPWQCSVSQVLAWVKPGSPFGLLFAPQLLYLVTKSCSFFFFKFGHLLSPLSFLQQPFSLSTSFFSKNISTASWVVYLLSVQVRLPQTPEKLIYNPNYKIYFWTAIKVPYLLYSMSFCISVCMNKVCWDQGTL